MKEYIEREAITRAFREAETDLFAEYDEHYGIESGYSHETVESIIAGLPATDVAPVVRCRECKFYNKPRLGWCNFHMDRENQDDFCSYGQRKEAAHD